MNVDLKSIKQQARSQIMLDGITEMCIGILYIVTAFMRYNPITYVLLPVIMALPLFILEKIRKKMIYPRIGKINLKTKDEIVFLLKMSSVMLIQIPLSIITTILAIIIFEGEFIDFLPFTYGLIMFAISFILIKRTGSNYYIMFGIVSSILGLICSLLIFSSFVERLVYYFILLGSFVFFVGILKFIIIIKKFPIEQFEGI